MVPLKKTADAVRNGRGSRDQASADGEKPHTPVAAVRSAELTRSGRNSSDHQRDEKKPSIISGGDTRRGTGNACNWRAFHNQDDDDDEEEDLDGTIRPRNKPRVYDGIIRVGRDYQAAVPALIPPHERQLQEVKDRDLVIWRPPTGVAESEIEHYMRVAREEHGYNDEQACGLLFWHKHNVRLAHLDLPKFTPGPEEFTEEDKVLFEQALRTHGKHFRHIRQTLPHKSISSLIQYFYTRKLHVERIGRPKTRSQKALKDEGEHSSENSSHEDVTPPSSASSSPPLVTSVGGPGTHNDAIFDDRATNC